MRLDKNDFISIECKVIVQNVTSRTTLYDHTKISLEAVSPQGCVLRMPPKTCAQGHNLLIGFFTDQIEVDPELLDLEGDLPDGFVKAGGKVSEAATDKNSGDFMISLLFQNHDEKRWKELCKGFKDRQTSVTDLIKKVSE